MCIFVADMQHIVIRFILSVCLFLPLSALADNTGEQLLDEADSLYALQQYDAALQAAQAALSHCKHGELESDCLNLLAIIHVRKGEFDKAVTYAKQCYALDEKSGDPDVMSSSLNTLAGIYMSMRQPQEAEKYILKAIGYAKKADNPQRLAVLHGMASEVYHHLHQEERSLDYATQAYDMEKQLGHEDKMAIRQAERASALIALHRDAEARKALDEAIPGLRQSGNAHSLGIACNQMGQLMLQEQNDSAAVRYFNEALQIFLTQHDLFNESYSRKGLYNALRRSQPDLAMEHNDRYLELRDSLYDKDTGELLSKYAAEYGADELKAENRQMHTYIIIGIVCLVAVVCLGFVLVWWMRRRQHERIAQLIQQIETLQVVDSSSVVEPASPVVEDSESPANEDGNLQSPTTETTENDEDHQFLMRLVEVVNTNLPTGHYGVEQIAQDMNMSVQTFRRRLLSATGESPKAFISAMQMERAAKLLKDNPDMPIARVATLCGYDETNSFGRSFKRFYNVTPSQYRENQA